ncbi:MAG: hypothetical protein GF332_04750 [Candidatus Moranbacteria bacterium]|nr:hypothetical protein [Candidatus Moranbacteria bacterium]
MTLRSYLTILLITSALAAVAWVLIIYYLDPGNAGFIGIFLFYSTLFSALVGLFSLVGFQLRRYFLNNELYYSLIGLSFRQAILLSLIIIGLLIFQSHRVLYWLDAILYIIAIFLIEVYFLSD